MFHFIGAACNFWWSFWPIWLLLYVTAGPFVVKSAIAQAERHYLRLAEEAGRPQIKMDTEDWIGAIVWSVVMFGFTPLAVGWVVVRKPLKFAYIPVRAFVLPPQQHAHEVHVNEMDTIKGDALETAKAIHDIQKNWQPDDEVKKKHLDKLSENLSEQLDTLASKANAESSFDREYMSQVRMDIDRTRRGLALEKPKFKELTA